MATRAQPQPNRVTSNEGFFLGAAVAMALVVAAGFSLNVAMGRSSFSAPPLVHAHALVFMSWVGIYVMQNLLVARGNIAMHRRLGWFAAGWTLLMLVTGCAVTLALVEGGRVPFFFRPQHFLIFDPMTLVFFLGLTIAAIRMRHETQWHRRLHFVAMSMMLGPAFGRLLPVPLLIPYAFEATFAATMLFPIAGIIADVRRTGRVHPAWGWGFGAMIACMAAILGVTYSPLGNSIYAAVTAGTPGAAVPGLAFGALPPGL